MSKLVTLDNFESQISYSKVHRGVEYFKKGRVSGLDEFKTDRWQANVEGSADEYEVGISLSGNTLTESKCTCPDDRSEYCKHIVAALLAVREEKKRQKATAPPPEPRPPMPEMARGPEGILQNFVRLPAEEQRLLQLAALLWEPFKAEQMLEIFNSHLPPSLKPIAPNAFFNIVHHLEKAGLWAHESQKMIRAVPRFADLICQNILLAQPDGKEQIQKLLVPIRSKMMLNAWASHWESPERMFREMRIAALLGDSVPFKKHYENLKNNKFHERKGISILDYWMPSVFDAERMEWLVPDILAFLLEEKCRPSLLSLEPDGPYSMFLKDKLTSFSDENRAVIASTVGFRELFRSGPKGIEPISKYLVGPGGEAVKATADLISGRLAEALVRFDLAAKMVRKITHSPKDGLTGLEGICQIFAWFKTQDASWFQSIEKSLLRSERAAVTELANVWYYQRALLNFVQNEREVAAKAFKTPFGRGSLDIFFETLSAFLVDENLVDAERALLLTSKLNAAGFEWLEAEISLILNEIRPDFVEKQQIDELIEHLEIEPLVRLLPRIESWESALNLLLALSKTTAETTARESDTRLTWLVDFDKKEITGKEQTFGKKGWSAGRVASESRLQQHDLKSMTEADKRIVESLGYYMEWPGKHGSDRGDKESKLLRAMTGHPLLFLKKSPDIQVQLTEEKPVLAVRQTAEGGFVMSFSPPIQAEEGSMLRKESPTRWRVIHVSEQMAKIAQTMSGKTMGVPAAGADRLREVVENLAAVVEVESVFERENLPKVESDSRICLHLLPVGEGFHVETFVKPFSENPPYFHPAEGEPEVVGEQNEVRVCTVRDFKTEKKNLKKLLDEVPILKEIKPEHGIRELDDVETCLQLLLQINPLIDAGEIRLEWPKGEKFKLKKVVGLGQFSMRVGAKGSWFEVDGEVRVDENRVLSMQELMALARKGRGQFIELAPGQFMALTEEMRRRLRELDGLLTTTKGGQMQLHPLAALGFSGLDDELAGFEFDKKWAENLERLRTAFSKKYRLPTNLNADLRPYQKEGFEWISRCAEGGVGACLADDMGLGKTVQALAFLLKTVQNGPVLVAAPASVCRNWVAEVEKFAPSLTPILFGEGDRKATVEDAKKGDLVIVTYDLMTREADLFLKKKWATVILDEAQAIKNRATKRSETVMQLDADFRLAMSGTPIENHLGELWNLMNFLNAGLLGSLDSFNDRFAGPIERTGDQERRDALKRLVQPFILRRRKDEVLRDLPAKTEIRLEVELSQEERVFYEALRRNALEKLMSDQGQAGEKHLRILAEIMRLRRAACHPKLVDENCGIPESSKLRLFGEIVEELLDNNHKALVFSQFVGHLAILQEYLTKKGVNYQYLDGSTPLPVRQKRIEAFQNGDGDLFLISLKAGGTGLNLTAADFVLHMDPWWNPAVEDQATDRAHRIGQQKPVTVYRFVAQQTIEEKILKLHETKRDLADSLLSGSDMSAKLTADELLALMRER